ncbi:MAG TPA: DUF3352 domain-containing protein [Bacteroidales bacterium]|nr:DUF3352 domain-containing protein [Bacteroidales bacterium]
MKVFKWIFLVALLGGLGYLAWHFLSPYSKTEPLDAIPADAVFIAETDNLFEAWETITSNKAWAKLKQQPIFAKLGKGIGMMDTIIQSNRQLSEFVGHRKVYVSMHMLSKGKYDFAYVIDLRRISKILKLKDLVGSFSTSTLIITRLKGDDEGIFQIEMKKNAQKFYCYFNNNLFVGSFSKPIIEKSLKPSTEISFGKDEYFSQIVEKTSHSGIFRLYVNYSRLDDYLKSMLTKVDSNIQSLSSSLRYSGLTFDIDREGSILCEGYTMINDSVTSSLKAIINSGMGNSSIEEILPGDFSSSVSLCFSKFDKYFENMQETLKETGYSYSDYQKQIEAVENYLGISVKENFMNWIGEEVTLAQMKPMGLGKNNEFAVFLKTTSSKEAKDNLDLIAKRIKRRTPVRIEDVDYKGYAISYLSVKGFFKLILGKLFQKLETPYYTLVDDYVIFSNHPQVLKNIIDAYVDESYIEKKPGFSDFYSSFGRKSNALILVNTASYLKALRYDLRPQTLQQLEQNEQNLLSWPYMGFQLSKDGDYFKTRFYAYFNDNVLGEGTEGALVDSIQAGDSIKNMVNEWVKTADSYIPVDLKQEMYKESYADGLPKVEFEIKDGFRNGNYREFHSNGKLKIKGEYKNDKKAGTWKFYSEDGTLIYKAEYKNGEAQD